MTIKDALRRQSNNFSDVEVLFEKKTKKKLLGNDPFPFSKSLSISIVIPGFRSHKTIAATLKSIEKQTFVKQGGRIQVIVIDDASNPPLLSIIQDSGVEVCYVHFAKNKGAGAARDAGIALATNDITFFIDSDIVLPETFLSNHIFAHKNIGRDAVIVSFREDVFPEDLRLHNKVDWRQGDFYRGDHRARMIFRKEWVLNKTEEKFIGKEICILRDTNFFKDLGFGKQFGSWTLPMMVLTCAMSVPTRMVKEVGASPAGLKGWGFNDTCMAAKMIARGALVIPNLNSTVLHNLETFHTKPTKIKNQEFLKNKRVYQKMLLEECV